MIRVLVVDDSALIRRTVTDILNSDEEIEVIDYAKTGAEAIKKIVQLKPDVITLDIEMPDIDGLTVLTYIMHEIPTPVVILSANVGPNNKNAIKALELGAIEVMAKPGGEISGDLKERAEEIIRKIKLASRVDIKMVKSVLGKITQQRTVNPGNKVLLDLKKIVVIGASTGGPKAIKEIVSYFPRDIPAAILIVQHMPPEFTRSFASRINWASEIKVKEAEDGDIIQPGCGYIAPGDYHMRVDVENYQAIIRLNQDPKVNNIRPSVTVLMDSVAKHFKERSIGVLLTGMGQDGVEGMRSIKNAGGITLAQDKDSCVVFGMPRVAIKEGIVDKIVPLSHLGFEIIKCTKA
ncbi:MAG: chemotaxis response regulator protein-glutamate methylesterase [Candidatus Omnitrophota bacterium]